MTPLELHPQIISLLTESDRTLTDLQASTAASIPVLVIALNALIKAGAVQHYLTKDAIAYRLTK